MHKIKQKLSILTFALVLLASLFGGILSPASAFAKTDTCPYNPDNLTQATFTPWYKYLDGEEVSYSDGAGTVKRCHVKAATKGGETDILKTVSLVAIAIIELLTRLSALIAAGFIIYGSIQYITSQGEPEGIGNAKTTIANAIVGLIIVILAIGIVQFVGRLIQK